MQAETVDACLLLNGETAQLRATIDANTVPKQRTCLAERGHVFFRDLPMTKTDESHARVFVYIVKVGAIYK